MMMILKDKGVRSGGSAAEVAGHEGVARFAGVADLLLPVDVPAEVEEGAREEGHALASSCSRVRALPSVVHAP